jgi:uncharacterized membrane protein
MPTNKETIQELKKQIDLLLQKQMLFEKEIIQMQQRIVDLDDLPDSNKIQTLKANQKPEYTRSKTFPIPGKAEQKKAPNKKPIFQLKPDFENFIGENLISKIGIAILILGVSIGTKYSIEHQLISAWMRITFGYITGFILLGIGIRLKKNYKNYSAVLVSGAMAIMYFITFAAYSFYQMFPQSIAFALMLLFTIASVAASLQYNLQIIAHLGMVGAYAVPFLLSSNSGNIAVLFTYMVIINLGILVLAFKKYWKPLYISSFALTWLIYLSWFAINFKRENHFTEASLFLVLFFITFYTLFIAFKIKAKQAFNKGDVILLLMNSFIFFSMGYTLLNPKYFENNYQGLFAIANALIHALVSFVFYRQKLADRNLFYLVSGLVLVFITLAIPIQLNGNWVTLLWLGEALILFLIGRTRQMPMYEKLAYPLIYLSFISLLHDWSVYYGGYIAAFPETKIQLLFNVGVFCSILVASALGFIIYTQNKLKYKKPEFMNTGIYPAIRLGIPIMLFLVLYFTFFQEIATYWNQTIIDLSNQEINSTLHKKHLESQKIIWLINYSMVFLVSTQLINWQWIKNKILTYVTFGLSIFNTAVFLALSLYLFSELRDDFLHQQIDTYNAWLRYISIALAAGLIGSLFMEIKKLKLWNQLKYGFHAVLYISIIWVASSELIHWLQWTQHADAYKLGLSIFWGMYALWMVIMGIWQNHKHVRLGAFILFLATLIKLFFYDIAHLNTLSKTIVFLTLGILLLIISFLYNKYKIRIAASQTNN